MNKSRSSGGEVIAARMKALGLMRRNGNGNGGKEKDEDLLLFREMHKREKDHSVSLLQLVSEEFEANGGQNSIYGMAPGKFLSESGKNDYDWLKTPPATPLFPSLEMESKNAPELAVQRELPIIQPLAKLTANLEAGRSDSPSSISKAKVFPRYSTPSSCSIPEKKNIKSAPILGYKMNQSYSVHTAETPKKSRPVVVGKKGSLSHLNMNTLPADFNKTMGLDSTRTKLSKPKNREFSRSTIPDEAEATPNLRTDRSLSVSRLRSSTQTPTFTRRLEPIMQSISSSVSRARKQEMDKNAGGKDKDKTPQVNINRTQVLGSKMVDRVLNARMSNAEEKMSKSKHNTNNNISSVNVNESYDSRRASVDGRPRQQSKTNFNSSVIVNETSGGFGKFMSRTSLNIALKHMDAKRDSSVTARKEFIGGRRSVSVMKASASS